MDENNPHIDRLFRHKLADHSETPSPLAWKKMEERLSHKRKGLAPWMKIAASVLLMAGLSSLVWFSIRFTEKEINTTAHQAPVPEINQSEIKNINPIQGIPEKEVPSSVTAENGAPQNSAKQTVQKNSAQTTISPNLAEKPKEIKPVPKVEMIALPPLEPKLLMAQNEITGNKVEEMEEIAYTVTIISNGIRSSPQKENLVEEIENKIDEIGGFMGKVDQGFAELQDAKNNLFAAITTKKENSKN